VGRRRRSGRGLRRTAGASLAAGSLAYLAGSFFASARLADSLVSPEGLTPGVDDRDGFLAALRSSAAIVEEFLHPSDPRDPVALRMTFASPGTPSERPTVVFLHGKGGNATEWAPDAVRALETGFNVLCPDLRGHGGSGGDFVTFGYLEKGDLAAGIDAAREKCGLDPSRLGLHACSAGCLVALQYSAGNPAVRALWLESPFSNPRAMARQYLHRKTGLPPWSLSLVAAWAMFRASRRVRRRLGAGAGQGWDRVDPVAAARRLRCPVFVAYGDADELVPPRFVEELLRALPRHTSAWAVARAGHCHHEDEPEKVEREEYERRWREFFSARLGAGDLSPAP
jgi:pimeloyl-ACP methyl ester carboxylesterase